MKKTKKQPQNKPQAKGSGPMLCELCDSDRHTTQSHEERLEMLERQREEEYNQPPERQHAPPPSAKAKAAPPSSKKDSKKPDASKGKTIDPAQSKANRSGATVELGVGLLKQNVNDGIGFLSKDPDLYQRGGEFVRVTRVTEAQEEASIDEKDERKRPTVYAGTPRLMDCPPAHMLVRMCAHVPCSRYDSKKEERVLCDPPMKLVMGVLAEKEYPNIRYLRGIVETPFQRASGTICQKPGYDKETGYLYAPLVKFPEVPDKPTQKDAKKAYRKLHYVYKGLEFVSDTDRAVPIAGILTILAQAAIRGGVPIFLVEANTPGTGKTNVCDTIGIVTSGRPMPRRTFPGPNDELRKVVDSYAKEGTRYFLLDNIRQDFGGEALESLATSSGEWEMRLLGETQNLRVEWRTVVFGSGNNIGYESADIVPRVLVSKMQTASEDPRARDPSTFLIKQELRTYVREHRVELAAAALTILRAYTAAGRPKQDVRPWGSFEAWNDLIPPAIRFAGGPDVNECRLSGDKARAADTDSQHLLTILDKLPELYKRMPGKPGWAGAGDIIEACYDSEHWGSDPALEPLRGALEGLTSKKRTGQIRPNAVGLGHAFRRVHGRVIGGKRLVADFDKKHKIQMWAVESVHHH